MKILINRCFGGFGLSDIVAEKVGCDAWTEDRDNPELIAVVESVGLEKASRSYAQLAIVEIPDEATDWQVQDYDGMESVVYVLNGKLHWV